MRPAIYLSTFCAIARKSSSSYRSTLRSTGMSRELDERTPRESEITLSNSRGLEILHLFASQAELPDGLRLFIFGCLRNISYLWLVELADDTSFDFVYVASSRKRKQVFSSFDLRNFRECQNKFCHSAQLSYLCKLKTNC